MKRLNSMDRSTLGIIGAVVAVILFVAINVFANTSLTSARLDFTESKLFTLSDGTREVLQSVQEPVTLRLFASRTLAEQAPAFGDYIARVRELLQQYSDISGGMVRLEIYNPEPYSVEEDEAVAYGLQGVPLVAGGELLYFGLAATNSTDDQEIIPFFDTRRERYLEYDLTRLVYNLANPKKPVVGLMSYIPIDADPLKEYKPWVVVEQMEQFFDVKPMGLSMTRIPDEVDVLMVVHPGVLKDETIYAIDQFVLRGGRAMIFVDPHSEADAMIGAAMRQPPGMTDSDLEKLFTAWGIDYTPDKFVGDRDAATKVEAPAPGPGGRSVVADYLAWIGLDAQHFNSDNVVTGELQRIFMSASGAISVAEGAELELEPLISSSPQAMLMDATKIRVQPDPLGLLDEFEPQDTRYAMAALITGRLKSAFPDGPPEPEEGGDAASEDDGDKAEDAAEHLTESQEPVTMIVVADTDLLSDRSWLQFQDFFGQQVAIPTANNAAFVINALDNLTGSTALVSLRSRGLSVRPFHRVEAIRDEAERTYRNTEQELLAKMRETEEKIGQIHTEEGADGQVILTDEQRATLASFRADLIDTRRQLREVQHNLHKDIDSLDGWLKILNIWLVPAIVSIIALVLAWIRRSRYRPRSASV